MAKSKALSQKCTLQFGKENIGFDLVHAQRKHICIIVYPDKSVEVRAPENRSIEYVLSRVKKRAPWIIRQVNYFDRFHPLPIERKYVSGETHYYLGRQYRLKVIENKINAIKLLGKYFHVQVPEKDDSKKIEALMKTWYRSHARTIFTHHLSKCYGSAKSLGVAYPKLVIRQMKKRWGSCTKAGDIILNVELIKAPIYCIDYVIMHELCHLKIHNHDKGYFKLLSKYMPDWLRRKERLERVVI
jgi:predicted metal-dependent hydrolase